MKEVDETRKTATDPHFRAYGLGTWVQDGMLIGQGAGRCKRGSSNLGK